MLVRYSFWLVYGASGVAALIYEVTWTRLLTLQMGQGIAAASTVLAAFMGGLAVGAAVGGRVGGRLSPSGALRTYAALELAVAALALLLPFELELLRPLFARTYADGESSLVFPLVRVAASLCLLAVPATAMGATFPVASRWMVLSAARAANDAGRLYAVNTLGAALGAVLAGFVLLPSLGIHRTIGVAVALNLAAAVVAWLIAGALVAPHASSSANVAARGKRSSVAPMTGGLGLPWIAGLALGLSGLASLTLQVSWTRLLALILGPTTYAFSAVVAVFIGGLAIGSAGASPVAARSTQPVLGLSVCLLSAMALAAAAASAVDWALLSIAEVAAMPDATFAGVIGRQTLIVTALLAPMTIAFGAVFPFAVAVGTQSDDSVISDLGVMYALNTAGAIGGALLGGFLLIPRLGLHGTFRFVIVIVAVSVLGLILFTRVPRSARLIAIVASSLVLLFGLAMPSWNEALLSSGAYKYAYEYRGQDLKTSLTAGRLLYYREGATATVSVREVAGIRSLSIDGKVDASNVSDMLTQRLLGHLPLLVHPNPRRVAIVGLGSGVTLGAALKHPISQADVLEISPEVIEASSFFEHENHRALADPRTRLIVGDGRSHLMLSESQYDVIISEPSNPWMAGIASLFTHEFFQSARARLADGGVLCQWAHTYDMSDADLRSIVATFLSVFHYGSLWLVGEGDILLIGSIGPVGPRLEEVARHWQRPGVASDLLDVGVREPFALLSLFVAEREDLARYAADAPVQTDDRLALEFSGPRSVFGRYAINNDGILREVARRASAPDAVREAMGRVGAVSWRDRGWMLLQADAYKPAWHDFARALELDPSDPETYEGMRRAAVADGSDLLDQTRKMLRRLAADRSRVPAGVALSRLLAAEGAIDEAIALAFDLSQRYPDNLDVLAQLASVLSDAGDLERLQAVVARLRKDAPTSEATHYFTASLLFMQGRPDLAVPEAESAIRKNPGHARAQNLLGAALATMGDLVRARELFHASLDADPRQPGTYANLATLEMQAGNRRAAAQRFAEALTIDPTSEIARRGLAEATAPR